MSDFVLEMAEDLCNSIWQVVSDEIEIGKANNLKQIMQELIDQKDSFVNVENDPGSDSDPSGDELDFEVLYYYKSQF